MLAHPDFDVYLATMKRLSAHARPFRGTLYRACAPIYANTRDLLTGEGSRKTGGRWNTAGSFTIVYLAQTAAGAMAEALGLSTSYGFDPDTRLPLTLVAIEAHLNALLDLRSSLVRRALAVAMSAMTHCDWRGPNSAGREALTQAIGRAAFDAGFEGIIVPSAAGRLYRNLNIFPANLASTSPLSILRAEQLPPPPSRRSSS